jgi:hypothetical protein
MAWRECDCVHGGYTHVNEEKVDICRAVVFGNLFCLLDRFVVPVDVVITPE